MFYDCWWSRDAEIKENERLAKSVESYITNLDRETARDFLSRLPMYDKDGQLIPEDRRYMDNFSEGNDGKN